MKLHGCYTFQVRETWELALSFKNSPSIPVHVPKENSTEHHDYGLFWTHNTIKELASARVLQFLFQLKELWSRSWETFRFIETRDSISNCYPSYVNCFWSGFKFLLGAHLLRMNIYMWKLYTDIVSVNSFPQLASRFP